ncbi:unnamed protein product [Bursaphelenchus xylophilus]|uniref:(pine wood nematode) hypothetical protein n=1 Tax=Bursaphelenchus xylophilus TaxID=6326 RepID=A0A811LCK7_BURXY|nr:unnamed protein product [Bursaphelenchus xylophilus]CAG9113868.1 unnamed protein product [Bursaphelenchus xylophilus]
MGFAVGNAGQRAHCELYERTLAKLPYYNDFNGKSLLEVGCGVGGGIRWIQKVHPDLDEIKGIDKWPSTNENPTIVQGNAEALPFKSNSFDIVLNIESSHLYSNPRKFFAEAYRVLKPGGHLCWADLRRAYKKEQPFAHAENAGLTLVEMQIINEQVLRGAQLTSAEYDKVLDRAPYFVKIFKNSIRATYCAPGTKFYNKLKNYETFYWICLWKKPSKSH